MPREGQYLLHETTPLSCSNLDNHLTPERMWMNARPDNNLDAKRPHEWHINDDDDLWLCLFSITNNKYEFRATQGREHLLNQIAHIENNTKTGRDLTRNKITDLLYPLMQSATASKEESKDG